MLLYLLCRICIGVNLCYHCKAALSKIFRAFGNKHEECFQSRVTDRYGGILHCSTMLCITRITRHCIFDAKGKHLPR